MLEPIFAHQHNSKNNQKMHIQDRRQLKTLITNFHFLKVNHNKY